MSRQRAEDEPYAAAQYEGEIVSDHEIIEEVVVDRYATLDALKRQGKLPRPQSAPAARTGRSYYDAGISSDAEKSLTLAEALVQHATALEQAGWVGQGHPGAITSEVAHAAAPGTWTSIDSLPPANSQYGLPIAAGPIENFPQASEPRQSGVAVFQPASPVAYTRREEPELIVVEDDRQEFHVQAPPQATPVKRQEYRQLFARLRRS